MTIRYLIAALFAMALIGHASAQSNSGTLKIEQVHKAKAVKVTSQTPPAAPVAQEATEPVQPVQPAYPAGSHEDWMNQAGINPADFGAVDYIVSHESSWNYDATEPTTGAHGLPQALPYSKTGCGWDDPICQLRWANEYAVSRYGGWWNAYSYWVAHHNW